MLQFLPPLFAVNSEVGSAIRAKTVKKFKKLYLFKEWQWHGFSDCLLGQKCKGGRRTRENKLTSNICTHLPCPTQVLKCHQILCVPVIWIVNKCRSTAENQLCWWYELQRDYQLPWRANSLKIWPENLTLSIRLFSESRFKWLQQKYHPLFEWLVCKKKTIYIYTFKLSGNQKENTLWTFWYIKFLNSQSKTI